MQGSQSQKNKAGDKQTPAITAVIPAYNAAHYLPMTIQSVIDQSFSNWELLVVDDGSTDETAAVVQCYSEQDSRIQLISKPNGGVSSARNLGAQKASSTLIAFLDADDRWLKEKLSAHVDYMANHPHVGVSYARVELIDAEGESIGKLTNNIADQLLPQDFFYSNPTVTTSNMVIRRDLFLAETGFDGTMQYNEDVDLLLRIAIRGLGPNGERLPAQIAAIDRVLVQYRLHESGLSSTLSKMEAGWITLMAKAARSLPELVAKHYNAAYGAQLQYLSRQTLRLNLPASAGIGFANRALRCNGLSLFKNPKMIAIALLIYLKWVTFDRLRITI